MTDAEKLIRLTGIDTALIRLKKQLDSLPQRAKLLEVRTKKAEVETKARQVEILRQECEETIAHLQEEEASLKGHIAESQAKIDETSEYRELENLSHEIESLAKKAERAEFDSLKAMERLDKIAVVEGQVTTALQRFNQQDDELIASYQADAAVLQKEMATLQQHRALLMDNLPSTLCDRYERARTSKGGAGAAQLEGGHCSGCRVEYSEGQFAKLTQGPEITECPYCHRILVVRKLED